MEKYEMAQRLQSLLEQAEEAQMEVELRDIPGYEGLYAATKDGRIWSYKRKIFLKHSKNKKGYHLVCLCKDGVQKNFRVHRAIALAWIPNPLNLPQVGHDDDNVDNNDISNLYWTTNLENSLHNGKAQRICKKVRCVENDQVFDSLTAAAKWLDLTPGALSHALRNPNQKSGGYHWEYVR